jgi:hypothetical protein
MGFADRYGEYGWGHTTVHWLLSAGLWIGIFELFLCLMVLCNPIAAYHLSLWVLLCIYIVEVSEGKHLLY